MAFKDRANWFLLRGLGCARVVAVVIAMDSLGGVVAACECPTVQTAVHAASKPNAPKDLDDPKLAGHFAGRVMGPDDQPIAGARLFVVPTEPAPTKSGPVRALTNGDGRFEFDAPDMTFTEIDGLPINRQGLLAAVADGFAPDWVVTWGYSRNPIGMDQEPVRGASATLRLVRGDVPIHGRLLDQKGEPLAGAHVRVSALRVPQDHNLDADLRQFGQEWPFHFGHTLHQPIILPGVEIEAIADAEGRFRIGGLGRDRVAELTVTAPGVVDTNFAVMTRDGPDLVFKRDPEGFPTGGIFSAQGFTLRLKPGRTVRGIVRDRETHAPIPGMWVIGESSAWVPVRIPSPFRSGENGRYAISGIWPGNPNLQVTAVPQAGQPFLPAVGFVGERSGAMIDCPRGIPFRLKLVDEAGKPIEAKVEYRVIVPNPHEASWLAGVSYDGPRSRAAMTAKGDYQGVVIPGPGAVLVTTPGRPDYRPAYVDPKAFFAPGKSDWTDRELITAYGTHDTLITGDAAVEQRDYAAIVLVNPPAGSKPLELSATIYRDNPRRATILDPAGQPVIGVQTEGLTPVSDDTERPLRAATIPITKLHPTRSRRILFVKEDRKLIGFLLARGDGEAPYMVRLEPWAMVAGRIVDENGEPLSPKDLAAGANQPAVYLGTNNRLAIAAHDDPLAGKIPYFGSDREGRFRIVRLVPGQHYSCEIYRDAGSYAGPAFENLVLKPGEFRDLGDIRWKPPGDLRGK